MRPSNTYTYRTGCGHIFVILTHEGGELKEIFLCAGKGGGCMKAQCETVGKLSTSLLKLGYAPIKLVRKLKDITCHNQTEGALSCSDAIARAVESFIAEDGKDKS